MSNALVCFDCACLCIMLSAFSTAVVNLDEDLGLQVSHVCKDVCISAHLNAVVYYEPISASVRYDITALVISVMVRMAPIFVGYLARSAFYMCFDWIACIAVETTTISLL